jgi:hypothetical protein
VGKDATVTSARRPDDAPHVAAPSREDPVARLASGIIGGPAGRRLAASGGFWRAASALVLLAVAMLGGGVLQKQHCRTQGWSTPDMFWHACYSDIPVLYTSAHLGGASPLGPVDALRSPDLGQPPLAGLAMWAVSAVVSGGNSPQAPRAFFDLSAAALTIALVVAVAAVAFAAGRRRSWDAAHVALAPVLLTAGLLSYELLAVALVATALLAWSRGRALAAGLLLGAAACAAPAAAILVVPVLALGLRARAVRPAAVLALTAGAVWVGVRLLVYPDLDAGIPETWAAWRDASPGYGSLWLVPSLIQQSRPPHVPFWPALQALSASAATTATLLGLAAVVIATFVLAFSTRRRPRLAHVALVAVAGCLIVLKSLPVQSSLLLLPLVALAGLRWRDHLLWATTELAHFVGVWLFIAAASVPNRGLPAGFYLVLLVARLVGIGWLAAQAWRQAADPELDPVRTPLDGAEGEDDPLAGPVRERDDEALTQLA